MVNKPKVYIIILVFNGKRWLINCIASVLKTNYLKFNVLVVDNSSSDDSIRIVQENFPKVELIKNKINYGFAEGNNIGIRYALSKGADYIVLLNQDTTVDPDWILELINVVEQDKKIGILSPVQYDYQGADLDKNFKLLLTRSVLINQNFSRTQRVIGAAMLITRDFLMKVGLFDPVYFCYYEETDLCRRAVFHGYTIGIAHKSKINHYHTLVQKKKMDRKLGYLLFKNEFYYSLKDPYNPLFLNFINYFKLKFSESFKQNGYFRGMLKFIKTLICFIPILFYLPRIVLKRNKEKKEPFNCYI